MKLILSSLCALFVLSSCFSSSETPESPEGGLMEIDGGSFTMSVPANWQEVSEYELVAPSQGELALAYRASEERNGYFNNIVVLKNENRLRESTQSLMKNNINTLSLSMQSFQVIAEESLNFSGNTEGKVIIFEGKYGPQTPTLSYIQTAQNCDDQNYFITISVGSDLGDYTRYYPLLASFRCN